MRKLLTTATLCLSAVAMPILGDLAIRQRCFPEPAGGRAHAGAVGAQGGDPSAPGDPAAMSAMAAPQGVATIAAAAARKRSARPARPAAEADPGDRIVFAMADGGGGVDAQDLGPGAPVAAAAVPAPVGGGWPASRIGTAADAGQDGLRAFALAGSGVPGGAGGGASAPPADGARAGTQDRGIPAGMSALGVPMTGRDGAAPGAGAVAGLDAQAGPGAADAALAPDITAFRSADPLSGAGPAPSAPAAASAAGRTGIAQVPEPGSLALAVLGLVLAGWIGRAARTGRPRAAA